MAHYFLFPEKDTTIYSHPSRITLNSGIDEILSLKNEPPTLDEYYSSRILMKFDTEELLDVIDNITSGSISASLKLFQTEHENLSLDQHIEVNALHGEWNNGTGRYNNSPQITDGVSWIYVDNSTLQTPWSSSLPTGVTMSYYESHSVGGGAWYTGSGFSVSKTYGYGDNLDLNIDVTSIVLKHYNYAKDSLSYPDGIPNNGFILKRSSSQEFITDNPGDLNFFSLDTHTIYPPFLDISWDDSSYTATDNIMSSGDLFVTLNNNKAKYRREETTKFRFNVRELYPTRRFVTTSNYLNVNYFTSESYYSIIDYATKETVVPFGPHSKMSSDSQGMYFTLYMNGLQEERYYYIILKHHNDDGVTIYDNDYYFKITKS